MIASQEKDVIFVLEFHCHEQNKNFHSKRPTINVISQKQDRMLWIVIDVGTETEHFHEISELSMDVTNNGDRLGLDEDVGFVFDKVVEADNNVFDKLEGNGFFLIETLFKVGDVELSIGGLEVLDVDGLLFLHGVRKRKDECYLLTYI